MKKKKNPISVAGGMAAAKKLTKTQRIERARKGGLAKNGKADMHSQPRKNSTGEAT